MTTVLDTFITRFGFETDTKGIKKAEKGLADFKASAIKIAAAIGGILAGGFLLTKVAEAADETIKWADANGLVVESLGELEFAVQRQGGSVEGLRSSLSNMNRAIGEVERGTGRAKLAFEDYGLSIKKANGQTKTADELLIDLNKKFTTLSRAQQFDLAMKMGIDKGTILLLQTAPDEIARLRMEAAKLGVLSRQDAVAAALYIDGLTNIAQAINAIKFEIAGFVFEPLANFFKIIANGISMVKDNIQFVGIVTGLIGILVAWYKRAAIWAGIMWLVSLGPISLLIAGIGAVIALVALITDDFIAFFKGQSSAIGDLVKKWPWLGDAIFAVKDSLVLMFDETIRGFKLWWSWLTKIGDGIIDFIKNPIDSVSKAFNKLPSFGLNIGGTAGPVGVPSPASPILTRSGRAVSQTNQIRIGELKVDARGGDSKEIARNVSSELSNQLKNTVEDFDSSIAR